MNTHEVLLDEDDPERQLETMAALRDHVDGLADTAAAYKPKDVVSPWHRRLSDEMFAMIGSWPVPEDKAITGAVQYVNPSYVHAKEYSDLEETCECGQVRYRYDRGEQMDNAEFMAHTDDCSPSSQRAARARLTLRRVAWLKRAGLLYIRQPVARKRLGFEHDFSATRLIQPLAEGYHDWYGRGKTSAANTMTILRGWGVDTQLIADAYGVSRQCVYTMKDECEPDIVTARSPDALVDHRRTA